MKTPTTAAALRGTLKIAEILKRAATRKQALLDDDRALKQLTDQRRKGMK